MTRHLRNAFLASIGIGALAVGAATVALAHFADDTVVPGYSATVEGDEEGGESFVTPVVGSDLFTHEAAAACISADDVVTRLEADRAAIGGQTVMLADGLEQAFADAWRRETASAPVNVSTVVAHIFQRDAAEPTMVDVVEIDGAGCAMTRTILSADEWARLLQSAAGIGV